MLDDIAKLKELMERRKAFPGHKGRPGKKGGSLPKGAVSTSTSMPNHVGQTNDYQDQLRIMEQVTQERIVEFMEEKDIPSEKFEMVRKRLERNLRRWLHNKSVSIRGSMYNVRDVISDGRFKTQHETGSSAGLNDPSYRMAIENTSQGISADVPAERRPVYGFVNITEREDHKANWYGNVEYVLNSDVAARTTVTIGDSLDEFESNVAVPMTKPTLSCVGDGEVGDILDRSSAVKRIGWLYDDIEFNLDVYVEAHVHGGVGIKDVNHVILHGDAITLDNIQEFREANIIVLIQKNDGSIALPDRL